MFPSAHTSLLPERQLDRFIRFSKVNRHIQYTDMQTTERATSATIGRIYAIHAMRVFHTGKPRERLGVCDGVVQF